MGFNVRKDIIAKTFLTPLDHVDFQWLPTVPKRGSESVEGDVPRLQLQSLGQDSEPTITRQRCRFI